MYEIDYEHVIDKKIGGVDVTLEGADEKGRAEAG